mmetsp:Transcript_100426/g.139604  ORF Transcript_100426/g.139604 Transcript_100426/m.139604 type:complete len:178 (+) Transcript_100426:48-581(+)
MGSSLQRQMACSVCLAVAAPSGPTGQGVDQSLALTAVVPANQAVKLSVTYSAAKEVRAQIWYSENDQNFGTNSNRYIGNGPHVYMLEEEARERSYVISGWSKNCRRRRNCAPLPWVQEPSHVFDDYRTVGFEDSHDGPYVPGSGTYDDIRVTMTCLNDVTNCPDWKQRRLGNSTIFP